MIVVFVNNFILICKKEVNVKLIVLNAHHFANDIYFRAVGKLVMPSWLHATWQIFSTFFILRCYWTFLVPKCLYVNAYTYR